MRHEIATPHMSKTNLQEAQEAILWFQDYFLRQDPRSQTQILAATHIRKLKYFCTHITATNVDAVSQAEEMHFSLGLLITQLKTVTR